MTSAWKGALSFGVRRRVSRSTGAMPKCLAQPIDQAGDEPSTWQAEVAAPHGKAEGNAVLEVNIDIAGQEAGKLCREGPSRQPSSTHDPFRVCVNRNEFKTKERYPLGARAGIGGAAHGRVQAEPWDPRAYLIVAWRSTPSSHSIALRWAIQPPGSARSRRTT